MRKKIGTVLDSTVVRDAKYLAVREGRSFADVVQDALAAYVRDETRRGDALRACEKFCSHEGPLTTAEIDRLLAEDILSP